jgi:S-layer protein
VTNATSTALTVNVDNAGYTSAGAAVSGVTVAAGAAATTINLNAVSKSNVAVSGAAATTLNITGAGDLTLSAPITTATKIDGSAATGNLTLGTLNAATVTAKTGSGNDSLTLSATTKASVDTGAGNDSVTLASAVAAGSTITLGAGNDKLLVSTGGSVAASTATAVTTIDGGDGTDTVAAVLINAANAAQFKNFENIDLSASTPTALDIELMTGSTITGLTLTGGAGGATVNNVAAGVGLSVSGSNTGTTTIGVKSATTGTADSFTTTFAGTAGSTATATTPDTIAAGTVVTNGIESLQVVSGGTGFVTNTLAVTDSALQTLTITGDKGLALTFAGTNGTTVTGPTDTVNGVKMIDGSAATGVLNINTTNVTNVANAGLTVKTGSAKDVITLAQKATVDAGAGDDTIHASADGGTFTGGAGKDLFDLSLTGANGTKLTEATGVINTTITDIAAGDMIQLDTSSGTTLTKVTLDTTVTNLDQALALASNNSVAGTITWFQYGTNTYIVENTDGTTGIDATDIVVKLIGTVDLSNSTVGSHVITIV